MDPKNQKEYRRPKTIYQTLETQLNQLIKHSEMIIGGDFNTKVQITTTKVVTTTGETIRWTRINRNKTEEKSVIDYIATSEHTRKKTNRHKWMRRATTQLQGKPNRP